MAPSIAAPAAPPAIPTFCTPALEATATVVPTNTEELTWSAFTAPGVVPKAVGVPSAVLFTRARFVSTTPAVDPSSEVPVAPEMPTFCTPALAATATVVPTNTDELTCNATTAPGVVPKLVGVPTTVLAIRAKLEFITPAVVSNDAPVEPSIPTSCTPAAAVEQAVPATDDRSPFNAVVPTITPAT